MLEYSLQINIGAKIKFAKKSLSFLFRLVYRGPIEFDLENCAHQGLNPKSCKKIPILNWQYSIHDQFT